MDLQKSMTISASGMTAQSVRMRVIAENLANADSVSPDPFTDPYRRKIVSFSSELDRAMNVDVVQADKLNYDQSDFGTRYDPGNPAADGRGYIRVSNVNSLLEMMDMRQAQRSYQSNLNAMEAARRLASMTVDLLR